MKKTPKKKIPTIDEISEMAADGKDVSKYFTKKFRVRQPLEKTPIQRVNVDFNFDMLEELDALAKELIMRHTQKLKNSRNLNNFRNF